MDRLFVFGDSWAFNYFSKNVNPLRSDLLPNCGKSDIKTFVQSFDYYGHWTDYISNYYDVLNYAETGASIENIIYQFGYLDEYRIGDRIVIIFPTNERLNWIHNNEKNSLNIHSPWLNHMPDIIKNIIVNQLYNRKIAWNDLKIIDDEKQFINKIPQFFKQYNPVLISWNNTISDNSNNVFKIEVEGPKYSISYESGGKYNDPHLGINGNYK